MRTIATTPMSLSERDHSLQSEKKTAWGSESSVLWWWLLRCSPPHRHHRHTASQPGAWATLLVLLVVLPPTLHQHQAKSSVAVADVSYFVVEP